MNCWSDQPDVARDLLQSPLRIELRVGREDQERPDQGEPFRRGLLVHHLSEHVAWDQHVRPSEVVKPLVVGAHGGSDLGDPSIHFDLLHDRLAVGVGLDHETQRQATLGLDRILRDLQHLGGDLDHCAADLERRANDELVQWRRHDRPTSPARK